VNPSSRALLALGVVLFTGAIALAAPTSDHVCKEDEGKSVCSTGKVRMCAKDGALAACVCPPGASASGSQSVCAHDPKAKGPDSPCVVPDATIAKSLGASLDFGELSVPSLPTHPTPSSSDTVTALDSKAGSSTLSFEDLAKLAAAHEAIEGGASYEASQSKGAKAKSLEQKRDTAVERAIEVRKRLLERFPKHTQSDVQRVGYARSLLRRSAYRHVPGSPDRELAKTILAQVTTSGVASRDAAFILGEEAVREGSWSTVVTFENDVLKHAAGKIDLDDAACLAAAHARLGQARLSLGDAATARSSLVDAVLVGVSCAPRAECVSASAGARNVLASVWAATGSLPRNMAPVLEKGTMPRVARVRPMVKLAEIFATSTTAVCLAEAEEARAYAQVIR
jgi:hypothetical protein